LKFTRDGWGGLAVLVASLFLYALTLGLQDNPLVPIGPGFYPRIVLGLTAVLALAVVLADLRRTKPASSSSSRLNYSLVGAMFAVFGLYCGALPYLGFRVSTFAYVAASNAMLDWPKGARGWLRVLAVALITTVAVYLVFERYLTVLLPRGRLTGF
jgi:putative tricarboxylic transport membrane protein